MIYSYPLIFPDTLEFGFDCDLYVKIVELILELYGETARRILCYFTPSESKAFYEASLALIKTYADHQVRC